jgi:hypothetical protein
MIRQDFNIPFRFVQQLEADGRFAEFAVWLKLKTVFKTRTIVYNWSYGKLSNITNISITTLKKYLPSIIDSGWAVNRDGHLSLRAWKHVCGSQSMNGGIIHVTTKMTFNETLDRLRALSIVRDYKEQKFIIELRTGRFKSSVKTIKKLYKRYRPQMVMAEEKTSKKILTSTRRIANQTGLSQSGAEKLLKRLNKSGVVKTEAALELLKVNSSYVPMVEVDNGYLYYKKGNLYLNKGTAILSVAH